ncbi:MAG: NlpC/P60 family protein [Oscillospiraceae bacterium]|jgi:cell wall-associated NlpC family hydrolase
MRKAKLLLISAAMAVVLTVPAHAASLGAASVTTDSLNLRSGPATSAPILTTADQDAVVILGDKSNGLWYRVVYRGFTGYMNASYLHCSDALEGDFGNGTIRGSLVTLHTAPDLFSASLGYCQANTTVKILGVSGNWYKVLYGTETGYLHSDDVAVTVDAYNAAVTADAKLTAAGDFIVEAAMKYLGCPYVYGGSSPRGFDCSGFVQYVCNECGISVTRTAASIYAGDGVSVDKSDLRPGDILCFSSSSNAIGHVGIYIGDGQFIHASNSRTGVIISPLDMDYWTAHYAGAKRVV